MSAIPVRPELSTSLRDFALSGSEPVLLLDGALRIVAANAAALALVGPAVSGLPAPLSQVLGEAGQSRVQALRGALGAARGLTRAAPSREDAATVLLPDGRVLQLALYRLEVGHWALRLSVEAPSTGGFDDTPGAGMRELIGMFWDSPFPATLQDADFKLVAVNAAFVQFCGYPQGELLGQDLLDLQPEADRPLAIHLRTLGAGASAPLVEERLIDPAQRERWFRAARRAVRDGHGRTLHLSILQDCSAEHAAREQADRSERDLDHWFDMSPLGMVLFDDSGLLVRTNPAFESLAGPLPVTLHDASSAVQHLLAWDGEHPSEHLVPGAEPLRREAFAPRADSRSGRLRAIVRAYETPGGHRRYMATVEDLSAEEERDLARMQIGALMDTAGGRVATFQDSAWVSVRGGLSDSDGSSADDASGDAPSRPAGTAGLQSIGREMVVPDSLSEYERMQSALREGRRDEARYAIRHPDLGLRWLLTRIEPGRLASGKRTTSVVTLDVTDKEQVRSRNEQLLRELGTILESSPAGIVYLRGDVLVRCNARFERMVGLSAGSAAGRSARELFVGMPVAQRMVADFLHAIEQGTEFQTEFEMPRPDGVVQWCSLSAQSSRGPSGTVDAIAVLSDITRLKLQQAELETLARDRELMFSLSDVGIAFMRDGRIQRANDALEKLCGHASASLEGLPVSALFGDRDAFHQAWGGVDAALRQSGRWSGERLLHRADGTAVWVQASKRLVVPGDPGGGIIASYVNVDDRRRAEASLAQQADTTRAVLNSVLVGIVTVGREGIEWMNRSARRMFGGKLADFVGQPIGTVATADEDHPFRRTHYLDALTEGEAQTFECRVQARDGRQFWVAGNAVVTRHETRGRQLTYALLDIERRREAEVRSVRAQASLQRIIDMAPMAITVVDADSLLVVQANQTAADAAGLPMAELIGAAPDRLYSAPYDAQLRADMLASLERGELTQREYKAASGRGARHWDARILPLAALGESARQLLVVATDVTEQRAAQQAELEAALAQRDMLVKEVHHRIKNNLQGVAGLMQQIAKRKPEVAGTIAEVVGQVQAIAQVYGLQVGASGPLDVRSVVEAITGSVQRTFGRDIGLKIDSVCAGPPPDWTLPEAESIPIALTLNELLTNASKHASGGRIDCTLSVADDRVDIAIANAGRLPPGFDLAAVRGGVSGLGLVRALLPRRHASLGLAQEGERVVARISLRAPGVLQRAEDPREALKV